MGSDIEAICREATMLAIRRYINTSTEQEADGKLCKLEVTMEDFEQAIRRAKEQTRNRNKAGAYAL